jgi:hypothetical protein
VAGPGESLDSARFSASGDDLLAAPHVLHVAEREWAPLPRLGPALEAGLDADPRGGFSAHAAEWTPDGAQLLVYAEWSPQRRIGAPGGYGGPTQRLLLLDGRTRELAATLDESEGGSGYAALAGHDALLVAAGQAGAVWTRAGERIADLPRASFVARNAQFSADGSVLAVARADGSVALHSARGWNVRAEWKAHADDARGLAFDASGELLATGGWDGKIKLWDLDGNPRGETEAGGFVAAVALADGRLAAVRDGTVLVYEL